jgi:hypothetical protein
LEPLRHTIRTLYSAMCLSAAWSQDAEIEEEGFTSRTGKKGRFVLALGVVIAAIAAIVLVHIRTVRAKELAANQCIEQYDAFLKAAKEDLTKGDRPGAINSLLAARAQLNRCQIPSAHSVSGIWPY